METERTINDIFKNLSKSTLAEVSTQFLETSQETIESLTGFDRACLQAKVEMLKLFKRQCQKLDDLQIQAICNKLKPLGLENQYLLQQGLINLYIEIYDEKNKEKSIKIPSKALGQINHKLLHSLDGLIKYFFLQNELKHFRKYKGVFHGKNHENLQGQDQAMQQKIKKRIWEKRCSQLFKQYLKNQQANKNKQLCRICYKKIDIIKLAEHVDYCGRKTFIKEQLSGNFEKRMEIVKKLKIISYSMEEQKDFHVINKIISFYKNLNDTKNKRRMSLRCKDAKLPLFFYQCQINIDNQKIETKLLSQLSSLENRAFFLDKKLQQIESEYLGINPVQNNLKLSVNSSECKKQYRRLDSPLKQMPKLEISKRMSICSSSSISSYVSDNSDQSKSNKDNEFDSQQEEYTEIPTVSRKIRKKFTEFPRDFNNEESQSSDSQINYGSISLKNFEILKLLGIGAFGRVYLVRRNKTDNIYALKVIKIDKSWGQNELQSIKNQYGVYKQIAGDHLVTATFSFQQKNAQFFVLQYMPGGDLSRLLQQNVYLSQKDAQFYLAQILLAIQHLHNSGIIHRDLKPQNIILDSKGHTKLTDFGLSEFRVKQKIEKVLQNEQKDSLEMKSSQTLRISNVNKKKSMIRNKNEGKIIGTPDYIAPQIIEGISLANSTIDWWSFGVIAYEMLVGCRPFSANSVQEILLNIEKGEIQWPQIGEEEDQMSPIAADFIKNLLKKNFQQRLGYKSIQQIKNHEFFKGVNWKNLKNMQSPIIGQGVKIDQIEFLSQDKQLRKQIEALIQSDQQQTNKLKQLRNYVRYDLLTAETLQSVKAGTDKKQRRIRKLKSIATNLQNRQPEWTKQEALFQNHSTMQKTTSKIFINI